MTFSIVAYDPKENEWGIAVQSKFVAVGCVVPFAKANIGAIATQAYANTSYGPKGLALLKSGFNAEETVKILTDHDKEKEQRQVGIIDAQGNPYSYTGSECFDYAGHYIGKNYCCQGNILAGEEVIISMGKAYENETGDMIEKFFAALEAAQEHGGDKRGRESAAILIVKEEGAYDGGTDRYIDIRVDEHPTPIQELKKVFQIYDLCILNRDDPDDIVKLEGEIVIKIKRMLKQEGFYNGEIDEKYNKIIKDALIKWMHTNNFEVKERDDDYMWGSVFRYIDNRIN
ncbi:MAG: DUF1028 domain-containing protein [Candidatus Lokiarchaeota archaeon]|nr:DUF1028 domain-containing protein [Candidatus Lokiarchaeota archaeon]MBD3201214.1 DUF1028 domain-containing protein [Candidatus Lokiarchaeota archaeon]